LQHNLRSCSRALKKLSYKQFILPVQEYAAAIWDPYHLTNINKIEMIHHRAARFVLNRPWRRNMQDSVTEMLTSLEWPPLQLHRKFARLTLLYKIIHNLTEIPSSYLPTLLPVTITRSNHDQKFLHYYTSIDNYKYSFFPRTVPEWNELPQDTINQPSTDSFKQSLHYH